MPHVRSCNMAISAAAHLLMYVWPLCPYSYAGNNNRPQPNLPAVSCQPGGAQIEACQLCVAYRFYTLEPPKCVSASKSIVVGGAVPSPPFNLLPAVTATS